MRSDVKHQGFQGTLRARSVVLFQSSSDVGRSLVVEVNHGLGKRGTHHQFAEKSVRPILRMMCLRLEPCVA